MTQELERRTFKTGEVIINEGEHSTDFFSLRSGSVAIFKGTRRIAGIDTPGSLIGEMSFFIGEQRSATVIALDETEVEVIPKDKVIDLFAENPDFGVTVAGHLAGRLKETSQKLAELRDNQDYLDKLRRYSKNHPDLGKMLAEFERARQDRARVMREYLNEKSIMSQKIVNPVTEGAIYAVDKMLNTSASKGEAFLFSDHEIAMDAGSIVQIHGECEGWYILAFPKGSALRMVSNLVGEEVTSLDDEAVGFIKELNNILSGQLVARIKEYTLEITPPTTILGKKALKKMVGDTPALVIPIDTEFGEFYTLLFIEVLK